MFNNTDSFLKKITKIKVKSFSDQLLRYIDTCLSSKSMQIKINNNELYINSENNTLHVSIRKNKVNFEMKKKDISINGEYVVFKKGYYVKINDVNSFVCDLGINNSYDVMSKEIFKVYDKNAVEQFRRVTVRLDDYYENKQTGERVLHDANNMKNYISNHYIWRLNDRYIIKRNTKQYVHPEESKITRDVKDTDDCLVRFHKIDRTSKEMPDTGDFYGIDNEAFFSYLRKKSTVSDDSSDLPKKKCKGHTLIEIS